ncbi:hypothetical protein D9611_012221 [Ephemerocybe angulata]|uniref:CCHC-type domain-containing protein n=1 Tax=Ephemerocybe angulata TaxID=980116 RepID=A0A8H5C5B7_9AGAR|nr:hypothetical protein D9611_012221 [Tulosesus angulatus]
MLLQCGADVSDYLQKYTQLVLQVDRSGYTVSPIDMIRGFILHLPHFMVHFINNFNTWCNSDTVLSGHVGFDDVLEWLEKAEASFTNLRATHRQNQQIRSVIQSQTYPTLSGPRPPPPSGSAPRSHAAVGPGGSSLDPRTPGARPSGQQCYNCRKVGHTAANCRAPGGNHANVGRPMGQSYLMEEGVHDEDVLMADVDVYDEAAAEVPAGDVVDDIGAL